MSPWLEFFNCQGSASSLDIYCPVHCSTATRAYLAQQSVGALILREFGENPTWSWAKRRFIAFCSTYIYIYIIYILFILYKWYNLIIKCLAPSCADLRTRLEDLDTKIQGQIVELLSDTSKNQRSTAIFSGPFESDRTLRSSIYTSFHCKSFIGFFEHWSQHFHFLKSFIG